jgi:L,D-transpeptidase ErfK/SrfK
VLALLVQFLLPAASAHASGLYTFSPEKTVIGSLRQHRIRHNESLLEAARLYGIGYNAITEANPGLDPWIPPEGIHITVPSMWVIPEGARKGILINLGEMRLYYFTGGGRLMTYAIGVGRDGFTTPLGTFRVVSKKTDPVWRPSRSSRLENPALPASVPPGPDNPLGAHALYLSIPGYLIHGTNRPFGVGRRVSHGCIRLYPEDIADLFRAVRPGTPVAITYQPVKVGIIGEEIYLEVHPDYLGRLKDRDYRDYAEDILWEKNLLEKVDFALVKKAAEEKRGIPVRVDWREGLKQ